MKKMSWFRGSGPSAGLRKWKNESLTLIMFIQLHTNDTTLCSESAKDFQRLSAGENQSSCLFETEN